MAETREPYLLTATEALAAMADGAFSAREWLALCQARIAAREPAVPLYFPVALSLGVDPVHLGILTALCIEIGSVIPPVGLNLFVVSGVTGLPVTQVIRGSFPFCVSGTVVLFILLLFPLLALWLPAQLITSHF